MIVILLIVLILKTFKKFKVKLYLNSHRTGYHETCNIKTTLIYRYRISYKNYSFSFYLENSKLKLTAKKKLYFIYL